MSVAPRTFHMLGLTEPLRRRDAQCALANWTHWQAKAERFGTYHAASWADKYLITMEIANLRKHLTPGGRWLDAGCANGYTTFRTLSQRPDHISAFDFSPLMVDQACLAQPGQDPEGRITFTHGNVLEISEPSASIDQAYTVRVLINLPSWAAQQRAIKELHRVLKPGGKYILSEAFLGSQAKLNALRDIAGLPPLHQHEFNLYLEEQRLESFVSKYFEIVRIERFSSLYYLGSRFLRELAIEPDCPESFEHPINELTASLVPASRSGDFGVQKAYILTKV